MAREIPWIDPAEAFARWADDRHVAWLDSAAPPHERSRFSYLAVEPFRVIEAGGPAGAADPRGMRADPFDRLARALAEHAAPARAAAPAGLAPAPFTGGAVGFLGYELGPLLEPVPRNARGALPIPDLSFGLYDVVLAFDRRAHRAWLCSSGLPEAAAPARARRAEARAAAVLRRLGEPARGFRPVPPLSWRREVPRDAHAAAIARILEYIRAGDIYQANFTTRFLADLPDGVAPADIYARLRATNRAPFGAYLGCGERRAIASCSPERFIRLDVNGRIESRPIKGTRPRGASPEADSAWSAELQQSEKDRAENLMIVDLLRNDIGRVAEIGSVRVPSLFAIESFPAVHHLVSTVEARLRPGLGPVDLLRAAFPGGSITGAPKIRAMQIIAELESSERGPYCGSAAWIGWDGAMDSSILIRTATVTPDLVALQAGGGIVIDSDPSEEFHEMMTKVRPLLAALGPLPA